MLPNNCSIDNDRCETSNGARTSMPFSSFGSGAIGADELSTESLKTVIVLNAMKAEVDAAVNFLAHLLVKARLNPPQASENFRQALTSLLIDHYAGHWYPTDPLKGSGYRCLRVNGVMHPLLANAAALCQIPLTEFRRAFPAEFTIWIDPGDVNVRIGEEGSIGVYFEKNGVVQASSSSLSAPVTPVSHSSLNKSRSVASATTERSSTNAAPPNRISPVVLFNRRSPSMTSSSYFKRHHSPSSFVNDANEYYALCGNVHIGGGKYRDDDPTPPTLTPSATTPTKRRSNCGAPSTRLAMEA